MDRMASDEVTDLSKYAEKLYQIIIALIIMKFSLKWTEGHNDEARLKAAAEVL